MNSTIIVGAGIIGLLTAIELQKAGQKVTLIDRGFSGQESSWAGGGIISPLYPWRYPDEITRLAGLSQLIYPELLEHMQQATGIDPEFLQSGMLILGDHSAENPEAWARRHAINMQPVDATQIRELAPEASDRFETGLWFPDIYQVRNPRLVSLARTYLKSTDITLVEQTRVSDILIKEDRVTAIITDSEPYTADQYLISGGAWTSELLKSTGFDPGIEPVKGQMLLLKGAAGKVRHITLSEDRYLIPRKDGRILVGSTTEKSGFNKQPTTDVRHSLLRYAVDTVPALASHEIELHWAGLRPGSANGLPCIGRHPSLENLFINSGHYRNGLVMAPASAQLMSEMMLQKSTCLAEIDYAPRDVFHLKK
jgi:glycine oxidase